MASIISKSCAGPPAIGDRHDDGKWRAVVGWNHTDDTPNGIKKGMIWCWVSKSPEKFQVFDQDFNRSLTPGDRRDCGVANFTMIRMFHPYWTEMGRVPLDGVSKDKKMCRNKYHELIRQHRLSLGLPVDDLPEEDVVHVAANNETPNICANSRESGQSDVRSYLSIAKGGTVAHQAEVDKDQFPGTLELVEGYSEDNPMFIT